LKQQYGIHMATRLQTDESNKEAKWSDMYDDEDEWAPDTVEWMDGTKTTVAPAIQTQPISTDEEKPAVMINESTDAVEAIKDEPPVTTSISKPSSTGSKTILKPGVHTQAKLSNTSSKGPQEKPTLVAKAPAPVPTKSPWAALPPVDKVSPVQINPPTQQNQARFPQRDPHALDTVQTPQSPAKEIAADDFSRSWRGGERNDRELFNSHSGRYEPVNEARRNSIRDAGHKHPSLLQRPSGQYAPAEPSAAFQTSRSGPNEASSWGRRRNSSTVSGGSGRRMSFGRAPEAPPEHLTRRESQSLTGSDGITPAGTPGPMHVRSAIGDRSFSPNQSQWTLHASPVLNQVQPVSTYGPLGSEAAPPTQDPGTVQQLAMKERIERARLAKQKELEEEAKQEAEKRKRLEAKLASLPVNELSKTTETPKSTSPALPDDSKATEAAMPVPSPSKPPIPTPNGEVAQFGMMKVHPAQPLKKAQLQDHTKPMNSNLESFASAKTTNPAAQSTNQKAANEHSTNAIVSNAHAQDRAAQSWNSVSSDRYQPWGPPMSSNPGANVNVWGPPSSTEKPLGNGTFDSGFGRSTIPHQASGQSANVAAPGVIAPPTKISPGSQTTAGYEDEHEQQKQIPVKTPTSSASMAAQPKPIAPPAKVTSNSTAGAPGVGAPKAWRNFTANVRDYDRQSFNEANARVEEAKKDPNWERNIEHVHKGPNVSAAVESEPSVSSSSTSVTGIGAPKTWQDFAANVRNLEREPVKEAKARVENAHNGNKVAGNSESEMSAMKTPDPSAPGNQARTGSDAISRPSHLHNRFAGDIKDKREAIHVTDDFRLPVSSGKSREASGSATPQDAQVGQEKRSIPPHLRNRQGLVHEAEQDPIKSKLADVADHSNSSVEKLNIQPSTGVKPVRGSRFFPVEKSDMSSTKMAGSQMDQNISELSRVSATSPPPETASFDHPAFDGDASHPVVNLPTPKARVRLPPVSASPSKPVSNPTRPARSDSLRLGVQPIASTIAWQDRFDGLLGKKTQAHNISHQSSQPTQTTSTLAVSSASRPTLDDPNARISATVSLPMAKTALFTTDYDQNAVSKPSAEEALLEDREFGSLPAVNFPKGAHLYANRPTFAQVQHRMNSKLHRHLEVTTAEPMDLNLQGEDHSQTISFSVKLPGQVAGKLFTMPRSRYQSRKSSGPYKKRNFSNRGENNHTGNAPTSNHSRPRKQSNNYQSTNNTDNVSPHAPTHANSNWQSSSTRAGSHSSNPWSKRTSPAVVH
jgi:hypothetical protein